MKRLSVTHVGGENLVFDVADVGGLMDAVTRQDPCYPLTLEDGSLLYLNTRHIVAWSAEDVGEEIEPEAEAEPEPEAPVSESDSTDTRTVAQLKTDLEEGGVEYDSTAKKADLLKLAQDNNL